MTATHPPSRRPHLALGLATLLGLVLVGVLLVVTRHLSQADEEGLGSAAPNPAALAAVEGVYRDPHLTLRLRYTAPYLWARSGDGLWQRLSPTGPTTLRNTVLGYELDIGPALKAAPDTLPQVSLSVANTTRQLTLMVLPTVGGVPTMPYLRGSMNDWSTALALVATGPGQYAAETRLGAGVHEFKVGSADWHQIDLGGNGDPHPMTPGQRLPLFAVGSNIRLEVRQAGTYRFLLDLRDPRRPSVMVSAVE